MIKVTCNQNRTTFLLSVGDTLGLLSEKVLALLSPFWLLSLLWRQDVRMEHSYTSFSPLGQGLPMCPEMLCFPVVVLLMQKELSFYFSSIHFDLGTTFANAQGLLPALCLGITAGKFWGSQRMPGIEPGLVACKASTLSARLSQPPDSSF